MVGSPLDDPKLDELRRLARSGDWTGVRALGTQPDLVDRVEAGLLVCEAELRQGEIVHAKVRLQWAVPEAERRGEAVLARRAANMLGAAHFELGDLEEAEANFERALGDATRAGDYLTGARATNNLGMIANVRGHHDAALSYYRVALPAYQRLGYTTGVGETTHNIAITLRDLGQLDEADKQERRAIAFAVEGGSLRLAAMARSGRAELALLRSEHEVAQADGQRAADEFERLGDPVSQADALRVVGLARHRLGNLDGAATVLGRVIEMAHRHAAPLIEAEARRARAELRFARGCRDQAAEDVAEARSLFEKMGASPERARLDQWWDALDGS